MHSSRVRTPQRHNSESVLYMNDEQSNQTPANSNKILAQTEQSSRNNHRLFPVNTYVESNNLSETKQLQNQLVSVSEQQAIKYVEYSTQTINFTIILLDRIEK